MAKFTLEISMDNAAFDGARAEEVARILSDLADSIIRFGLPEDDFGSLADINGNTVGSYEVAEED